MGSYGYYTGNGNIPENKREEFSKHIIKILNYGGMMQFEKVNLFGYEISLLKPLRLEGEKEICFHYNYFEEDSWETAGYDPKDAIFYTEKIGSYEFCDVVTAAYLLYELYDDGIGLACSDSQIAGASYVGWINQVLGTTFSMKKRFRIWEQIEHIILTKDECRNLNFVPRGMMYLAGGTELADFFYIKEGTASLTKDVVETGTYPFDVYFCKEAIRRFLYGGDPGARLELVYNLLKRNRDARMAIGDTELAKLSEYSLFLPARVFVYLAAELTGGTFRDEWEKVRNEVYHDEVMKQYESDTLKQWRAEKRSEWIAPIRTADALRQDSYFLFYNTPEELKQTPNYYLSDDDRLYWWDGSDEVILSEKADAWLRKLAQKHEEIMQTLSENEPSYDVYLERFIKLLSDANNYYKRIFPFREMFYEFLRNITRKEYIAAIELFQILVHENKEEGKIINHTQGSWSSKSRNVTHNIARLRLKRYLSVMANLGLRKKYFSF